MNVVGCDLCPKLCRIAPGQSGECRIRVNLNGRLEAVTYGRPTAVHIDPIEKKPLYHFLPGTPAFSFATAGCNLHCRNCQNWEISQANPEEEAAYLLPPEKLVTIARQQKCVSVAATYSDPVVFYEYSLDTFERARARSVRTVLVTAAYLNPDPWRRLCRVADAATIDVKFFDDVKYRRICDATLAPILTNLEIALEEGVWLELSNLLIPTLNDDEASIKKLCLFIRKRLSADVPLHFLRFFPRYRMKSLPPTPSESLIRAIRIARETGLHYVYAGNLYGSELADAADTHCPACGKTVIHRVGYEVSVTGLENGRCTACGAKIAGVWR